MRKEIIQPNPVTMARYQYNVFEKRIMYQVIAQLQREMRGEIKIDVSLFGDRYFRIPYKLIDPEQKSYSKVRGAIDALRKKDLAITHDKDHWFTGGLVNWGHLKEGVLTLSLPPAIAPFLLELATGFTAYSSVVVMALQSTYSMRFYEWLSRFRDTGKWYTTPDDLREMLGLSDSKTYQHYARLKEHVIDVAQKELHELYTNGQSDICFSYTEKRKGRGRGGQVHELIFTIFWAEKGKLADAAKTEDYYYVAHFMRTHFQAKTDDSKQYVDKALNRIIELDATRRAAEIAEKAKGKENPAAYFRAVAKKELGI
ncbi:replication initiation protein [Rudanella paleaurantiibacter]|uniref:replication initiation protein n=1 Tax=Rudanella paleaurantiibacter TaxID=2614655 RepID=UPI0021CF0459|nr:replication initiation protein [Rudanella paleaurantiibacter]